jgi:hypothetical protein
LLPASERWQCDQSSQKSHALTGPFLFGLVGCRGTAPFLFGRVRSDRCFGARGESTNMSGWFVAESVGPALSSLCDKSYEKSHVRCLD